MPLFTSERSRKEIVIQRGRWERNVIHCPTYSTLCRSNRIVKALASSRRVYDEQRLIPNQTVYLNALFGSRKVKELIIDWSLIELSFHPLKTKSLATATWGKEFVKVLCLVHWGVDFRAMLVNPSLFRQSPTSLKKKKIPDENGGQDFKYVASSLVLKRGSLSLYLKNSPAHYWVKLLWLHRRFQPRVNRFNILMVEEICLQNKLLPWLK